MAEQNVLNLLGDPQEVVSFTLEDVLVPGIGIVVDAVVSIDYNNLEDAVSTDVIPIGAFVEEFLSNSNDPEFIQVVSNNLAEALLDESSFGLAHSLDFITVELEAAPGVVPFSFTSTSIFNPDGEADEVVSFSLQDVLVPGIGIVADATVTIDYTDLEAAEQQDVIPLGGFVREFLNDSSDPDFIQVVNNNLAGALLDFENLGSLVDDIEIELEAESSVVPFPFTSNVTIDGAGTTEQTVSFVLEDVLIPGIGIVVDANVNLDYINAEAATTDVIPIGAFVEEFLSNVTEPEFVQVVADNLSQAVFNDEDLGLTSLLDSVSVDLEAAPGVVPFPFTASFTEVATPGLITYDLSWEGDNGYSMKGLFSYDGELEGSIVTEDELTGMQLAFFKPDGNLLEVFDYDFPVGGEFNFNFDTVTDTVLQMGESDSDTGFDLGIDFSAGESGIGFFSGEDDQPGFPPAGTIGLTRDNPPLASDLLDQGGELIASIAETFVI